MNETILQLQRDRKKKVDWLSDKSKEFQKRLNDEEESVINEIEEVKVRDTTKLGHLSNEYQSIIADVKLVRENLESKKRAGQRSALFIATRLKSPLVREFQEKLRKLSQENTVSEYEVDSLGSNVTLENIDTVPELLIFSETGRSMDQKAITYQSSLNIFSLKPFGYTSLCLLSANELIVSDDKRGCLLLFADVLKNVPPTVLNLKSSPWTVAKIRDRQIAITLPDVHKVLFMTLSKEMTQEEKYTKNVSGKCYGIACIEECLVISFIEPAEIKIMDLKGNVYKKLSINSGDTKPLRSPRCLALSRDYTRIYFTDNCASTVTSITIDGTVTATYEDEQLLTPLHLTVDKTGSIYVCGMGSNNIHLLSADLTKVKVLVPSPEIKNPVSVAYCRESNRLYVGMRYQNCVQVFQIK